MKVKPMKRESKIPWLKSEKRNFELFHEGVTYDNHRDMFFTDDMREAKLELPLSICIRVTYRCNLSCNTCLADAGADLDFTVGDITPLLKALSDYSPIRLVWTGGEPTLNVDLLRYVQRSMSLGYWNVVSTNMTCGDPLASIAGQFFYNVSLYGHDPSSYIKHTGKDVFNLFVNNFANLFSKGHKVVVTIIADSNWRERIPPLLHWLRAYPVRKLLITSLTYQGRCYGSTTISKKDLTALNDYVIRCRLPFSVILPSKNSIQLVKQGYIVFHKAKVNEATSWMINGVPFSNGSELKNNLRTIAPLNSRLFTHQNYYIA